MAEKRFTRLTIELAEDKIEQLKSQLRAAGVGGHISATDAVSKAVELYSQTAKSVRLDEPERREIESRCGATVPLRNSRDILRAFEKLAGGPDAVTVELDPSIGDLMRDVARGLGYGLSEFAKVIIENSYWDHYLEQCEMTPMFFKPAEWKMLQLLAGVSRIRTAGDILVLLKQLSASVEDLSQSTPTHAEIAETDPKITFIAHSS